MKTLESSITHKCLLLLLSAFIFFGCSVNSVSKASNNPDPLLVKLSEIRGIYLWNDGLKRFIYSKKDLIEKIISIKNPHTTVRTLVACLDDLSPTKSTKNGKSVVMGLICYEALSQIAYYEHTMPDGDIAEKWVGHIQVDATEKELLSAKHAWENVLKSKSYILL